AALPRRSLTERAAPDDDEMLSADAHDYLLWAVNAGRRSRASFGLDSGLFVDRAITRELDLDMLFELLGRLPVRGDPRVEHPLLQLRIVRGPAERVAQARDLVIAQALGTPEAIRVDHLEAGQAGFLSRRHVGRALEASRRGDRQRAQLARVHERHRCQR